MASDIASIPVGSGVFLDANVFCHALSRQSVECDRLLARCAREELYGFTTFEVVGETTHRLMLAEACKAGIIRQQNASLLGKHLKKITALSEYWASAQRILSMSITMIPTDEARLHSAHRIRARDGLMTNDSIIVAAMADYGLTVLASCDKDFDHVYGVSRFAPTDI